MKKYQVNEVKQLELLTVKEGAKQVPAKRVEIVSIRMVKESSIKYKGRSVRFPGDGFRLFKQFLGELDREYMLVIGLDTKNQPTVMTVASIGSLNAAIVHPGGIYKSLILSNSSSSIICHNHPSGSSEPSTEEIEVTKRLAEAGRILGIEMLDHLVIGDDSFVSLKEKGYL